MRWLVFLVTVCVFAATSRTETNGERVFRLGQLAPSQWSIDVTRRVTLPELAKLGFSEGRNLVIIERFGEDAEMPRLAKELLLAKVDAIVAVGPGALLAASAATKSIPIVSFGSDPTQIGLATSLAHPGGNVTGVVILVSELDAKRLDLLHQAVPSARRFAALVSSLSPQRAATVRELHKLASNTGIALQALFAAGPPDYPAAFASMRAAGVEALVIGANSIFYRDGAQLATLALEARLPTICEWADMAELGCLIGYGPDRNELRRRLAHYIAQVLRGAATASLPIETPTRFEFAINLRVARSLGLKIPADLLARADSLIE